MIGKPLFSWPRRLETGTSTWSNSMYVDPGGISILPAWNIESTVVQTTCVNARVLDLSAHHAFGVQWNDKRRDALDAWSSRSDSRSAIISEDTVRDPLLCAVDNIHISAPLRSGADSRHIRARCIHVSLWAASSSG